MRAGIPSRAGTACAGNRALPAAVYPANRRRTSVRREDVSLPCTVAPRWLADQRLAASASRLASRPAPGTPAPPRRRRRGPQINGIKQHRRQVWADMTLSNPPVARRVARLASGSRLTSCQRKNFLSASSSISRSSSVSRSGCSPWNTILDTAFRIARSETSPTSRESLSCHRSRTEQDPWVCRRASPSQREPSR
jgi:hypothetical protein